ncbi:MAG: hypothetical protein JO168_08240 [Solirubrobacterales bacterium]|nr:hypothetical protein [Solirubrobacterales bacterium]MBV9717386.1 hypothetical protein [Solirubrobacterales bacterium]
MELDDLLSTETAAIAAVTAAVFSPRTRETIRRGAVLGVAGVLKLGDVVAGAARGATRGVRGEETMPTPSAAKPDGGGSSGTRSPRRSAPVTRGARGEPTPPAPPAAL